MWTLRSRIILHRSQKSRILRGRSAPTSRGVLEAYSSQKPQFATVRLSMWKGAPNNAEGTAKQCIGVMMSFCSILLSFFKLHSPKCGDPTLGVKANWSVPESAAAKRMNLKAEFSAEWLRIWRYERGISLIMNYTQLLVHVTWWLMVSITFYIFVMFGVHSFTKMTKYYLDFFYTWVIMDEKSRVGLKYIPITF